MAEQRSLARIEEDREGGERSGVQGTPMFFINGVLYPGSWEQDALLAELQARARGSDVTPAHLMWLVRPGMLRHGLNQTGRCGSGSVGPVEEWAVQLHGRQQSSRRPGPGQSRAM